jgi:AcrR family transcriptional regulator
MHGHNTRVKALELFASRGFGQTGMRELASHMGLSPGSLYNHIESKQTLLFELIEELYDCLVNGLAPISPAQGNASDRLHALLAVHIDLHRSKALHFLVAERELHCLDKDQAEVNRLVSLLAEIASMDITPQLAALAKSSVSLLNNLPSWFADDQLDSVSRSQLMSSIVRASITGALEDLKCSTLLSDNRRA